MIKKILFHMTFFFVGVALFIGTFYYARQRKQHLDVFSDFYFSMYIAGEEFEHVCNPIVDADFDGNGEILVTFRQQPDEDYEVYTWVSVITPFRYTWEINGDIEHVAINDSGYEVLEGNYGEGELSDVFRIKLSHTFKHEYIRFKVEQKHSSKQGRYVKKILTPDISVIQPSLGNGYDRLNETVDIINNMPEMTIEEENEFGVDIMKDMMNVGKIGEMYLSPAIVEINPTYHNTGDELWLSDSDINISPENYSKNISGITWETEHDIFIPSIEYIDTFKYKRDAKIIDMIYLLSTFIISSALIEIIKTIIDIAVKRKK